MMENDAGLIKEITKINDVLMGITIDDISASFSDFIGHKLKYLMTSLTAITAQTSTTVRGPVITRRNMG